MQLTPERDRVMPSRFGVDRLYRDAGSMASSSVASAVLGAAFWAAAAKLFPPNELGVMTAVLAAITATGVVLASGVGDAYTALLPAVGSARWKLYRRGQRVFWTIATLGGVGTAVATVLLLDEVRGSYAVAALVMCGVLVWSAVNVQSSAVVALGRARWLPVANIATGLLKVALLPLLAFTLHWHAVELAFVLGTAAMVAVLQPAIVRVIRHDVDLPPATLTEAAATRLFAPFLAQSIASSGLNFGIVMASPFMVTAFSGPAQGALFALALSVVQILDLTTMAMSVSLVVHASGSPDDAWPMARAVFVRALVITSAAAIVLAAVAPVVLRWLDPQYEALGAFNVVVALCAVCLVRSIYTVWSGLQRARRRIGVPLIFNALFAVTLPVLMYGLCGEMGALGGAFALLFAQSVLSGAAAVHAFVHRHRGEGRPHGFAAAQ